MQIYLVTVFQSVSGQMFFGVVKFLNGVILRFGYKALCEIKGCEVYPPSPFFFIKKKKGL